MEEEATRQLIQSIKQLEIDLSDYRDVIKDNGDLSELHFAVSNYLTISDNRT